MAVIDKALKIKTLVTVVSILLVATVITVVAFSLITLQGVHSLGSTWKAFEEGSEAKEVHLHRLHGAMGYGGMIHQFKNYVLRQETPYLEGFQAKVEEARAALAGYQALGVDGEEKAALDTIGDMIANYERNIDVAARMIRQGQPPHAIDRAVKVDDTPALEALALLESRLHASIRVSAAIIGKTVDSVSTFVTRGAVFVGTVLAVLFVGFFWFSRVRLLAPLSRIQEAMTRLAQGERAVEVPEAGRRDEIGEMAQAFRVFKETALEAEHLAVERKQLLEMLEDSQRQLATMVDLSIDAIISVDEDQRIILFNRGAERIFGYTAEEALGQNLDLLIPERFREKHHGIMDDFMKASAASQQVPDHKNFIGLRKDGGVFPAEASISSYVIGGKTICSSILRDITQRKQMEEALRRSEQWFRDVSEAASDWFWEMDAELRFTYLSENFEERSGLDQSDIVGKRREEIPGIDTHGDTEKWRRHLDDLEAHRPYRNFTYRIALKDGRVLHLRVSGKPIFDKEGTFLGYRGTGVDITAEVEARAQTERLEVRLAETIQRIPQGYTLYDKDDRLILCNDRMREFFPAMSDLWGPGTPYEDIAQGLIERGIFDLRSRSAETALREAILFHSKKSSTTELRLADERWLQVSKHRTNDGGTVGIWTDITETKRREEALSLLLARPAGDEFFLTRAVEALAVGLGYRWAGIGRFSEDGETLDLLAFWKNGRPGETFSIPLNDGPCKAVAKKQGYMFYPDRLHERFPDFKPLRDSEAVCYRGNILLDEHHSPLGCVFAMNDHPDSRGGEAETLFRLIANWVGYEFQRKEAEEAIRKSKRLLMDAQRIAHFGAWEWDIVHDVLRWSDEVYRISGHQPGSRVDVETFRKALHPDDLNPVFAARDALFERDVPYDIEYRIRRPDGKERVVQSRAEIARDVAGQPLRMFGTVHDITERKRAEEALRDAKEQAEAASRAKSAFLANMSHELRTPLNAILGFSEVMENEYLGPLGNPKYREYTKDIRESGDRLLGLINNVLDLSRLADGKIELNEEVLDIGKVIEATLAKIEKPAEHSGVALANDAAPGIPGLRADPHRISQILLNLLLNAVKFTPRGGKVTVLCRTEADGGVSLTISDTGIGMSKDEIAKALESFGQVEGSYARKYEGAGLGLPLARSLVELHGGSLAIDSQRDKGTTVTIHFPPVRSVAPNDS